MAPTLYLQNRMPQTAGLEMRSREGRSLIEVTKGGRSQVCQCSSIDRVEWGTLHEGMQAHGLTGFMSLDDTWDLFLFLSPVWWVSWSLFYYCKDTMTKATYRRVYLGTHSSRRLESIIIVAGSKAQDRLGAVVGSS